jgi:endoglucanase
MKYNKTMNLLKKIPVVYMLPAAFFLLVLGIAVLSHLSTETKSQGSELLVLWPQEGALLNELQTFQVTLVGNNTESNHLVFWQISDTHGGELVLEDGVYAGVVSVKDWDWQKDNQYQITFTLKNQSGDTLASKVVAVTTESAFLDELVEEVVLEEESEVDSLISGASNTASVMGSVSQPVAQPPAVTLVTPLSVTWQAAPANQNQKFVFTVNGYAADKINAFWQTSGGHQNMIFDRDETGRFVARINFFGWQWRGKGPYPVSFVISDSSTTAELARVEYEMYWNDTVGGKDISLRQVQPAKPVTVAVAPPAVASPAPVASVRPPTPIPTPVSTQPPRYTMTSASRLYVQSKPAVEASKASLTNPVDVALLQKILNQPGAMWLNGNQYDSNDAIQRVTAAARTSNTVPTFVLYNIPYRDCGSYSSGGAKSADEYRGWINRVADAIGNSGGLVIVEPDALAQLNCAPADKRSERLELLRYAVDTFASRTNARIYIDAGHPFWVNAEEMTTRLRNAGVANATGFSLNVSNFVSVEDNVRYGNFISASLGGKRYVIDTSRNGNGPDTSLGWCNPRGRAIGPQPRLFAGESALDAFLWIKYPGESDGSCNGGPSAGQWWLDYALELSRNAKY